jgi:hypothetical protein
MYRVRPKSLRDIAKQIRLINDEIGEAGGWVERRDQRAHLRRDRRPARGAGAEGRGMSAPFDPAAWVERVGQIGLARVNEHAVTIFTHVQGPEARRLIDEWYGGSEEQCAANNRAACAYAQERVA